MTAPKGQAETNRALAFGAMIRKLRKERRMTLSNLAKRVPMSPSNISRIELGKQSPPTDEAIERFAHALDTDPRELLRIAGRYASGQSFEEAVLTHLEALSQDMHQVKREVSQIRAAIVSRKKR